MNKIIVALVIAISIIYNVQAQKVGVLCHPTSRGTVALKDWQAVSLENIAVGTTLDALNYAKSDESCKFFSLPSEGSISGTITAVRPGIIQFPWSLKREEDKTYTFTIEKILVSSGGKKIWFPIGWPQVKNPPMASRFNLEFKGKGTPSEINDNDVHIKKDGSLYKFTYKNLEVVNI